MAVLSADKAVECVGNVTKLKIPAQKADTFYAGAIVWTDETSPTASQTPLICDPATGDRVLGFIPYKQVAAAAGDLIEVVVDGIVKIPPIASIDNTDVGEFLIFDAGTAITDNPADCVSAGDTTLADNDAIVGRILAVHSDGIYVAVSAGGVTGLIRGADATAVTWE